MCITVAQLDNGYITIKGKRLFSGTQVDLVFISFFALFLSIRKPVLGWGSESVGIGKTQASLVINKQKQTSKYEQVLTKAK